MYIDLIFYKFTSNLALQLLIKVISVFGEKRTVYMRRFHTIITKIWICSQCNICFALGANSGIFWNYCISASEFPGQYIFSIFCGVIRWCTTALSTHKLTPVRANVCPSPFIVSNGLENFSAILRALIQGVVGSYLCATNSKPEGRTVFFRRVLFRSLCIGHNSQKSGESERPLSKLIAGKAFARASFRDFRSSGVNCSSPWSTQRITPEASLDSSEAIGALSAVSISLLTIPWENWRMAVARVGHDERHSRRSVVNDMNSSEDIFSLLLSNKGLWCNFDNSSWNWVIALSLSEESGQLFVRAHQDAKRSNVSW